MGIAQTKQTEIWILTRLNRPKHGCRPHRTDQIAGIGQTEKWVLARLKSEQQTDQRGRKSDIVQSRARIPKYGFFPDRADQNTGIMKTEQTEKLAFARPKYG